MELFLQCKGIQSQGFPDDSAARSFAEPNMQSFELQTSFLGDASALDIPYIVPYRLACTPMALTKFRKKGQRCYAIVIMAYLALILM